MHIFDKYFTKYIDANHIKHKIESIAESINKNHNPNEDVVFLSILNGAYMFTSDLCKGLSFLPEISFVKVASYKGTKSTGIVSPLLGLDTEITHKTVYIIEDIVDSGNTIEFLYNYCKELQANNIFIVSLLFKPESYKKSIPIDYFGFSIPNDFVVGYGMDYNGLGRNLQDIYKIQD